MARVIICAAVAAAAALSAHATHGILLVSDQVDGVADPQLFDRYYKTALRDAGEGYTYAVWDHYARGEPTFEDLRKYKIVIWFTSTSGDAPASDPLRGSITLSPSEQEALVAFLSRTPGTTTLMLSGMYIAWNCVADAVHEKQMYKPLFSDYLKLRYPKDNFDNWITVEDGWKVAGESSCPIFGGNGGKTYPISWRHHRNFPDQLEPAAAGGSAWWQDLKGQRHHRAVIHNEGDKANDGKYRVVLFSCPFENIQHDVDRAEVMGKFVEWAEKNPQPDVAVEPASLGRVKALFR
jgi:hypothetical protein